MAMESCPRCGMEKSEWPNATGVQKDGTTYCCDGCANGTGCTCPQETGSGTGRTGSTGSVGEMPKPN